MPYTIDLVRLAASAHAATIEEHLSIKPRDASDAILEGYRDALKEGGRPFVLAENHRWLRKIVLSRLRDATVFWKKLERLPKSADMASAKGRRYSRTCFCSLSSASRRA